MPGPVASLVFVAAVAAVVALVVSLLLLLCEQEDDYKGILLNFLSFATQYAGERRHRCSNCWPPSPRCTASSSVAAGWGRVTLVGWSLLPTSQCRVYLSTHTKRAQHSARRFACLLEFSRWEFAFFITQPGRLAVVEKEGIGRRERWLVHSKRHINA